MALTGWSPADFLQRLDPIWPGQLPFGMSIWMWKDTLEATAWGVTLGQQGTTDELRTIQYHNPAAQDQLRILSRTTANGAAIISPTPNGAWFHAAGAFVANNLHEGWLNGGSKQTSDSFIEVGAPDSTWIGISPAAVIPWQDTGALAEVSIWDLAGFSVADRDAWAAELAGGRNPIAMNADAGQPWSGALVEIATTPAYASLRTPSDLGPFSMTGTLTEFASHPPVDSPVGPPQVGGAVGVSPQVINLTGVVSGAGATSHEVWANVAPGDAFAGEVKDSLGPTLAPTVGVIGLDPLTEYNLGIRAIANGDTADSGQVTATTLDVATWTVEHNDTLIVALDEFADGDGVLLSLEAIELRWGKYEDTAEGQVDLLIEIENDGNIVESVTFLDGDLLPREELQTFDPPVEDFVNLRVRITAQMPGGANGQRAAVYWIQGAGMVLFDAPPPVPTGTNAVAESDVSILASWDAVGTATGYRLQFAQGATFPAGTGTQIFDGTELEFLHEALQPETQYAYRVLAYNDLGDGPWSDVFTATTGSTVLPPTPTNFIIVPISTTEGEASWDPVPAVDGYRIQLEPGLSFPPGDGTLVFDGVGTPDNGRLMTILGGLDPDTEYAARLASYRFI